MPARRTSGRRGRPPSNVHVKQKGRPARSSTRSGPHDLDQYAHKPKTMSRAERSRLRNMKKGWDDSRSEEDQDGSLRDDQIAERMDRDSEESNSVIEEESEEVVTRTRGRPKRAI